MGITPRDPSRREVIRLGIATGLGLALGPWASRARAAGRSELITRPIPSSGERIPVIGLGTNNYSVQTDEELAPLREVLRRMAELGGKVVDTAPGYGRSEQVIGQLLEELGTRDRMWIATKVTAPGDKAYRGKAMMKESFRRLRVDRVELMQVHNLNGAAAILPVMKEWKQDGRIRYIGVTTSGNRRYDELETLMRCEPLDFIQIDYSISNRSAADRILPLAADRGIAVMLNLPLGGRRRRNVVRAMAGRPLPEWAAEIDCTSWAQLFLKYNVSHPAVTCAIPGTTRVEHLEDNLGAARGRLPDAEMRRRIERLFDAM